MNTSALRVPVEQSAMVAIPGLVELSLSQVARPAEILVLDDDPQSPWAPVGEMTLSGQEQIHRVSVLWNRQRSADDFRRQIIESGVGVHDCIMTAAS